jgi:hypothetical protein
LRLADDQRQRAQGSTRTRKAWSWTTALHLCFGYAYVAPDKPNRYAFLPDPAAIDAACGGAQDERARLEARTILLQRFWPCFV